jgi:hypothetical protein
MPQVKSGTELPPNARTAIDEETIASRDIEGLVKEILVLFDRCAGWNWASRISFLDAAPR